MRALILSWWSSGQRARPIIKLSQFESCQGLHFYCVFNCLNRPNINEKDAGNGSFLVKQNIA